MALNVNRTTIVEYAQRHWFRPCDDGIIMTRQRGAFSVEGARRRHARALQPDPKAWQAVFLPEVDASGNALTTEERACFIRPDPAGQRIAALHVPAELAGRYRIHVFHRDNGLVDCAHYVSRCLTAGGFSMNHSGVTGLVTAVRKRPHSETRTLGNKVTRAQGERILNTGIMKPGDVITYFHQPSRGYTHSVLYLGFDTGRSHHDITCHTLPRFRQYYSNDDWSIVGEGSDTPNWRFTLLHLVTAQDPQPTGPTLAALVGWWKVEFGGRTEYYLFSHNGTVAFTSRAPVNGSQRTIRKLGRGYWFETVPKVFLCWPDRGRVEHWGMASLRNQSVFSIKVDDGTGRATRIP